MEKNFRQHQKRGYDNLRKIRDITMALIILSIGALVLFADKLGLDLSMDSTMQYLFTGLCLLYGGFRLYRGIKQDY